MVSARLSKRALNQEKFDAYMNKRRMKKMKGNTKCQTQLFGPNFGENVKTTVIDLDKIPEFRSSPSTDANNEVLNARRPSNDPSCRGSVLLKINQLKGIRQNGTLSNGFNKTSLI